MVRTSGLLRLLATVTAASAVASTKPEAGDAAPALPGAFLIEFEDGQVSLPIAHPQVAYRGPRS